MVQKNTIDLHCILEGEKKKKLVLNSEELLVRIKEKERKSFTIVNSFLFYSEPQYREEVLC